MVKQSFATMYLQRDERPFDDQCIFYSGQHILSKDCALLSVTHASSHRKGQEESTVSSASWQLVQMP